MAQNKFNFYAWVHTPNQTQRIDIVSIGIWEQIKIGKLYPANVLSDLLARFRGMVSKGKSPFNFHWTPYIDRAGKVNQGNIFRSLSKQDRSTIELRIQVYDDRGNRSSTLHWNFYEVEKTLTLQNSKNEIVKTFYHKFDTGSNQP